MQTNKSVYLHIKAIVRNSPSKSKPHLEGEKKRCHTFSELMIINEIQGKKSLTFGLSISDWCTCVFGDHVVSGIIRQIEKLGTTELKDKHMHNSDTIAQIIYYVLSCW